MSTPNHRMKNIASCQKRSWWKSPKTPSHFPDENSAAQKIKRLAQGHTINFGRTRKKNKVYWFQITCSFYQNRVFNNLKKKSICFIFRFSLKKGFLQDMGEMWILRIYSRHLLNTKTLTVLITWIVDFLDHSLHWSLSCPFSPLGHFPPRFPRTVKGKRWMYTPVQFGTC